MIEVFSAENQEGFFISTDQQKLDFGAIHTLMSKEAHWSRGIPRDLLERAIRHSLCFGLYTPQGQQVGFGRMVTDYTTFGWVTDVFINEEYCGQGLGRFLMETMLDHPDLQVLRRWLLGTSHAAGFYKKLGFEVLENPETYFTIHIRDMYKRGLHKGKY